jgi:hypothetical protein
MLIAYHRGMSQAEAMAKLRHERLQTAVSWDQTDPTYREQLMREAAADLTALAELLSPMLRQCRSPALEAAYSGKDRNIPSRKAFSVQVSELSPRK